MCQDGGKLRAGPSESFPILQVVHCTGLQLPFATASLGLGLLVQFSLWSPQITGLQVLLREGPLQCSLLRLVRKIE